MDNLRKTFGVLGAVFIILAGFLPALNQSLGVFSSSESIFQIVSQLSNSMGLLIMLIYIGIPTAIILLIINNKEDLVRAFGVVSTIVASITLIELYAISSSSKAQYSLSIAPAFIFLGMIGILSSVFAKNQVVKSK